MIIVTLTLMKKVHTKLNVLASYSRASYKKTICKCKYLVYTCTCCMIYLTHSQEPLRIKRCPPFSCRTTSGLPSAVRETEFHLEQEQPTGHKLNYLETPLYIKKFRTINSESFKDTYIHVLAQVLFYVK